MAKSLKIRTIFQSEPLTTLFRKHERQIPMMQIVLLEINWAGSVRSGSRQEVWVAPDIETAVRTSPFVASLSRVEDSKVEARILSLKNRLGNPHEFPQDFGITDEFLNVALSGIGTICVWQHSEIQPKLFLMETATECLFWLSQSQIAVEDERKSETDSVIEVDQDEYPALLGTETAALLELLRRPVATGWKHPLLLSVITKVKKGEEA